MAMLRLSRIFKNYNETGSLSEKINLHGFIGPHVFLTKSGEVGIILEVRGVDYECLDAANFEDDAHLAAFCEKDVRSDEAVEIDLLAQRAGLVVVFEDSAKPKHGHPFGSQLE